jgi:predicted ATPase
VLRKIELENFKSFLKESLCLKPLTVLTGLNSSGKSTVIQAVNMIFRYYVTQKQNIAIKDHASPHLLRSKYSKEDFYKIRIETAFSDVLKLHVFVNSEKYSFDKTAAQINLPVIQYISASRQGPENMMRINPEVSTSYMDDRGEFVFDFIEKNRNAVIHDVLIRDEKKMKQFFYNLNAWLQYISPGTVLDYTIQPSQSVVYPDYNGFLPSESGFGLSYILPVIAAILAPVQENSGIVILLENPEAHLHPQGQTAMGELAALAASSGKQIIVETHSDHFIDGIRIAARQKKIKHTDVIFHYITKESPEKPAAVETPELLEDGKLSFWPKGFFDQNMRNKAELIKK